MLNRYNRGISADDLEGTKYREAAYKYLLKAWTYYIKGDSAMVSQTIDVYFTDFSQAYLNFNVSEAFIYSSHHHRFVTHLLTEIGEIKRAEDHCQSLAQFAHEDHRARVNLNLCRGIVALAQGNYDIAIQKLQEGAKGEISSRFLTPYLIARTYMLSGKNDEAIATLEHSLAGFTWGHLDLFTWRIQSYNLLGQAYEAANQAPKAITTYEKFLGFWKEADEGIEIIEDAKERLAKLNS